VKPKIKEILFDVFSVAAFWVGYSIHGWQSLICLLMGSFCGAFALFFTLLNHRIHGINKTKACSWSFLLFVGLLLGALVYWKQCKDSEPGSDTPKPRIRFVLHAADSSFPDIELTNSIFFFKNTNYKAGDIRGNVVIPVAVTNRDFILDFIIINDSATESINDLRIWLTVAKKFKYSINDIWTEIPSPDAELSCWTAKNPESIFPDEHLAFRGFKFAPQETIGTSVPLNITIGVNSSTNFLIGFWLSFESSAVVPKSHILTNAQWSGSNGLIFTIPP
jgi:hypothetical protein